MQASGRAKEVRQDGGKQNRRGTIHTGGWVTQHLLDEIIHQFYGNVVHHDRVDDFMGAESGFEDPRNGAPQGPTERTGGQRQRQMPPDGQPAYRIANHYRTEGAHVELPLSPDIEQAASKI